MPSVLIVDDHEVFRRSAKALLEADGFDVTEADTAKSGIACARDVTPNLVLLDINLPDEDGFEVATRLASLPHPPAVILVSSRDAADYGPLIAQAPARGFIAKSELTTDAIRALMGTITS